MSKLILLVKPIDTIGEQPIDHLPTRVEHVEGD